MEVRNFYGIVFCRVPVCYNLRLFWEICSSVIWSFYNVQFTLDQGGLKLNSSSKIYRKPRYHIFPKPVKSF